MFHVSSEFSFEIAGGRWSPIAQLDRQLNFKKKRKDIAAMNIQSGFSIPLHYEFSDRCAFD